MMRIAAPLMGAFLAWSGMWTPAAGAVTERPIRSMVAQLPPAAPATPPPQTPPAPAVPSSAPFAPAGAGGVSAGAASPGAANPDLLFVVAGDNRPTGKGAPLPRILGTLFDEIGWIHPDLVLWSGDTVYGYCDTRAELEGEYRDFLRLAARTRTPLFNAPGNHEIHNGQRCPPEPPPGALCGGACAEGVFRGLFGNLYGSFDFAGAHFIALDTAETAGDDTIGPDQLAWLESDLESNRDARAIFVFCHTEFFGSPRIDPPDGKNHPPVTNRDRLHALFRRYPVKAVFSGHEHVFWQEPPDQHDGISYFVAGGGGAPAYAPPDRGGFAHYLVVRLTGGGVTYDVVEPGRLNFVAAAAGSAPSPERPARPSRDAAAARFWAVNGNDTPLPLRGLEAEVPGALGPCSALVAETNLRRTDGTAVPLPVAITACDPPEPPGNRRTASIGARARAHHLILSLEAPSRTSVPILIHRR
jgi:hypothetical protein